MPRRPLPPSQPSRRWRAGLALGLALTLAGPLARAAEPTPEAVAFFEKEVRPLFAERCQKCHGPKKQESGLRLDSREAMLRGGSNGPAVVPGQPDRSLLLAAVRHQGDLRMPPNGKLRDDQVAALAKWVALGAPWPGGAAAATRGGPITAEERRFWSFQPVSQPTVPGVRDAAWPLTTVDSFVLARLEAEGLRPVGPADRRTLLRRVTFDLTGLPPTPEEIRAFLDDDSPDAFDRVVERLLGSKHYGERWGRHWLDVARYADTAGDGADYPVREAYRYRNYVIDAFNGDKPYDEFLREQIAGDILAREGLARGEPQAKYAERVIATGYLAVGKRFGYNLNPEFQHLDIADTQETLGRSVLGLSLGCARCHDHKFDPVSTADYYALYGIFASSKFTFPGGEELKRPQQLVPLLPPDQAEAREQARRGELARLDAELKRLADQRGVRCAAAGVAATPFAAAVTLADLRVRLPQLDAEMASLAKRRAEVAERELYEVAYGVSEGTPADVPIQKRGEPDRPGPVVPRRFLEILGGDPLPAGATGSGRRELADWLTRPTNPLTARVIVNRVWQHHFGRGLVATPSDFGARGEPPTHPELLDYLAGRFMAEGWSIKSLHRLILRSRVYQLASTDEPHNRQADPLNGWLWRQPRRPLDADSIRDAMLAVSGRLDRSTPGPHPFPPVNTWGFTIHYPFHAVYDSDRRSVYLMVQRARRHPYLALFDGADPNISTAERLPTTTPTQALYLMNDPFVHAQAEGFARRLLASPGDDAARVRLAFELAQGREADGADVRDALAFLEQYGSRLAALHAPPDRQAVQAWAALGRVLLTANGFLYVD
jgi:mono/diheme cytochrome c family protein